MKSNWSRSLQMTLCAAAVCALGVVNAQTPPPPPPGSAMPPAGAQAPVPPPPPPGAAQHDGKKPHHMKREHRGPKGEHHHGQRGKYANPHQHEAAAVREEERAGRMPRGQDMDQYQRNALARCDVFREAEDRRSCVDRVRSAEVSGSVKDGGVLREYTEQVPVRP